MHLARILSTLAFAAAAVAASFVPAVAATGEKLTGMPLLPGSEAVTKSLVETKMAMCKYAIETKSYNVSNAASGSAPAWFAKTIPGARKYPYSAGGVAGVAMFSAHGDGMVHIEPGLLIYYKFTPNIPADRYAAVAQGGC